MDAEYLQASVLVRHPYDNLAVKTAGPAQGFVDSPNAVGGADDYHILPGFQTVHQRQELGHYSPLHLAGHLLPLRRNSVKFIYEDDGWGFSLGLAKGVPQALLRLAIETPHDFRASNMEETSIGLVSYRPGEQRLAGAGRPMQ